VPGSNPEEQELIISPPITARGDARPPVLGHVPLRLHRQLSLFAQASNS
jgi:hypothetical protein